MQPFDALTMRAVLQEARPLLLNCRVDKIYQLGRDELILAMRMKSGIGHLILSAQASCGRICLTASPQLPKSVNPPAFCQLLRKHLGAAILVSIDQVDGERVADLTFSCSDQLGSKSIKVLTAEIMGRHSNLIFWDRDCQKIIGASHVVTAEMSRQREVAAGLMYVRPPSKDKPNFFQMDKAQCKSALDSTPSDSWEQGLIDSFSGIGRHLAEELIVASGVGGFAANSPLPPEAFENFFARVTEIQKVTAYKPAMKEDLSRYSVLSWWPDQNSTDSSLWKTFPSVNDLVDAYFKALFEREQLQHLRDRIRCQLKAESDKLDARLKAASNQLCQAGDLDKLKTSGDLILANVSNIQSGQQELVCDNLYDLQGTEGTIAIALNPNLSAAQNAQHYYRQYAKARMRKQAATGALSDAQARISLISKRMQELDAARGAEELSRLKEMILDRGKLEQQKPQSAAKQKQRSQGDKPKTPRLMSLKSSDGWLIYVGRNRIENDVLISKLASPADLWLHVQGQEGAHVLIKNPNKQDPPGRTIKEAGQLAARFSKVSPGSKVRVLYTHVKYVKKIGGKDKPGLVRYENERTIEVDTAEPLSPALRKLFAK